MKNLLKFILKKKKDTPNFSKELLNSAYTRRHTEIDSLKKYDRGEKTITPSNLKHLSQCI